MPVRMKDIAEDVGVSVITVSKVGSGRECEGAMVKRPF
ncbi:MAG: LacI family DNA-binding transcriptional regulator [Acidobacteria bacterium]|nr:LacI family DNA-binding transcriptional regulator [Acidobacteriota bacterium]